MVGGWAFSADGIGWGAGQRLRVQPQPGESWAKDVRTPLGLVHEGGERFSLFYSGFEQAPDWSRMLDEAKGRETCAIGLVELRLSRH